MGAYLWEYSVINNRTVDWVIGTWTDRRIVSRTTASKYGRAMSSSYGRSPRVRASIISFLSLVCTAGFSARRWSIRQSALVVVPWPAITSALAKKIALGDVIFIETNTDFICPRTSPSGRRSASSAAAFAFTGNPNVNLISRQYND